ncbi:hypothetical protein VIGAN_01512000, partial [Vigna angularis var. angularis]
NTLRNQTQIQRVVGHSIKFHMMGLTSQNNLNSNNLCLTFPFQGISESPSILCYVSRFHKSIRMEAISSRSHVFSLVAS